jgi:hypothetical protein
MSELTVKFRVFSAIQDNQRLPSQEVREKLLSSSLADGWARRRARKRGVLLEPAFVSLRKYAVGLFRLTI